MSILWADPFIQYNNGQSDAIDGAWAELTRANVSTTYIPRADTKSMSITGGTGGPAARRVYGTTIAAGTAAGIALRFYFPQLPVSNGHYRLSNFRSNSNANQVYIDCTTTGQYRAFNGSGTLLGTSEQVITAASWNHFECKVVVDNTVGTVEIRHNGITVLNLTGVDTLNSGDGNIGQWAFTHESNINGEYPYYVSECIAWDGNGTSNNNFLGTQGVYWLRPNADTVDADWVPSTGSSGFALISVTPPNDANYIEALAVDDTSTFGLQDLPVDVTSVKAVIPFGRMFKSDSGDNNVQMNIISNASVASGISRPVTTEPTYWWDVIQLNPDGSVPWSPAAVNAMTLQYDRTV